MQVRPNMLHRSSRQNGTAQPASGKTLAFQIARQWPQQEAEDASEPQACTPISLRDWFAGQALSGMLSKMTQEEYLGRAHVELADDAYQLADAMLERSRRS